MSGFYHTIAERIRSRCPSVLQAEPGVSAEAAVEMLALGPDVSALVHPISDTGVPVREAGFMVSQREDERFGVTMALVFPGGFEQFEPARAEIKACLRGWLPEGASLPVQYAGGRTLQYQLGGDGARWLHLLTFTLSRHESYEAQA